MIECRTYNKPVEINDLSFYRHIREVKDTAIFEKVSDGLLNILNIVKGKPMLFSVYNQESELIDNIVDILNNLHYYDGNKYIEKLGKTRGYKYNNTLHIDGLGDMKIRHKNTLCAIPNFIYAVAYLNNKDIDSGVTFEIDVVKRLIEENRLIDLVVTDNFGINYASISNIGVNKSLNITDVGLEYHNFSIFRQWIKLYKQL